MCEGYTADRQRHRIGTGELLDLVWSLNDGWWARHPVTAAVTDFPLTDALRRHLVDRAHYVLTGPYE